MKLRLVFYQTPKLTEQLTKTKIEILKILMVFLEEKLFKIYINSKFPRWVGIRCLYILSKYIILLYDPALILVKEEK